MKSHIKHIVLVNAIFPPDKGASGRALFQLAQELWSEGFRITIVSSDKQYNTPSALEQAPFPIIRVKSSDNRNSYIQRLYTSYKDSLKILKRCKTIDADTFILCTDPPLMNYFAYKILGNRKYVLWTMDLYPEAFVAKGLMSGKNWFIKKYQKQVKKSSGYPWITLGEKQNDLLKKKYGVNDNFSIVIPCGVHKFNFEEKEEEKAYIQFAYTGNLGEAHSEIFLLTLIERSNPAKHQFLLHVFGSKAQKLIDHVGNKSNVEMVGWISEDQMSSVDIQIVSLNKEWTHICVPSKAVSAVCYGTPILFHGDREGDIYYYFRSALWHIPDDENVQNSIDRFYASLRKQAILEKRMEARSAAKKINNIYRLGIQNLIKYLSS